MIMRIVPALLLGCAVLAQPAVAQTAKANAEQVGTEFMVFDVSATEAAKAEFLRGLALLHNFEYARAAAAFQAAQAADPDFAMAYWGEAMTHNHPLWEEQDRDAARAILARLGATREARMDKVRDPREVMWFDAVETLYGEGTKEERDHLYLAKMRVLHEAYPSDVDARAFTGLAILGTSHGGRQIPIYMQAAGLLEPGFMTHPMHPGILHYLIHSYDDPVHAPLGERMAERYATVAPDAGHAQHMVSHIFHALADWEASELANINADAVVDGQLAQRGLGPTFCGHYNEWLAYALVQQGKDASAIVDGCRAQAIRQLAGDQSTGKIGAYRSATSSFSTIALYSGVTSGDWPEGFDLPEGRYLKTRFDMAYAALLQSRGDHAASSSALSEMKDLHAAILAALPEEMPDETGLQAWNERIVEQGDALVLLASGDTETGLAALRTSAEQEIAMPVVFGPPAIEKPSYELLGEELLKLGRKAEAADAFRASLAFSPGRLLSLNGLREAAAP